MGANTSKPTETKVFTPKTNIEIGSSLIGELEQSVETDYTRSQYTEKTFEAEVSKRLDQLTKEAQEKFDKTVKDAIVKEDTEKDKHLSSSTLSQKISEFQEDLEKRQTKFFQATEEVQKAKQDVVQCLTNNKDKPLNCWDEVKGFEKLVSQIN